MRDWSGSRVQVEALTVPCRHCHAAAGEVCVNNGVPLVAFPAHDVRVRAGQRHVKRETAAKGGPA